jgi:hypothetical protein
MSRRSIVSEIICEPVQTRGPSPYNLKNKKKTKKGRLVNCLEHTFVVKLLLIPQGKIFPGFYARERGAEENIWTKEG